MDTALARQAMVDRQVRPHDVTDRRILGALLEIPRDSMRVLMFVGQATGLGSNPIGIDRGSGGDNYIARFDRNGDKVRTVHDQTGQREISLGICPGDAAKMTGKDMGPFDSGVRHFAIRNGATRAPAWRSPWMGFISARTAHATGDRSSSAAHSANSE